MKIRLLDFQAKNYPEWAEALETYSKKYSNFDYRVEPSDDLAKWLEEADRIFYHYGERKLVDPLLSSEKLDDPRRKYVVFSGGESLGDKRSFQKTGCPILFGIGRTGVADLLPDVLERSAK